MSTRSSHQTQTLFSPLTFTLACSIALLAGCQSNVTKDLPGGDTPGSQVVESRTLSGRAFTLTGEATSAKSIVVAGESRKPLFLDDKRIAFANRRIGIERWQVFETDLEKADQGKAVERRVSFDAGNATPVAVLDSRLLIATSSDEQKAASRLLSEYQNRYGKTSAATPPTAEPSASMRHLMLEQPAKGSTGTQWIRVSREPAGIWTLSFDKATTQAIAVLVPDLDLETALSSKDASRVYRITLAQQPVRAPQKRATRASASTEPASARHEIRAWNALNVERPGAGTGKILDAQLTPDGAHVVWTDGTSIWTTTPAGKKPALIGDGSVPPAYELALDPSGEWIIFTTPSPTLGLNLMAIHRSGRCLRPLTELSGDEINPVVSPDGRFLLFSHRTQGTSVIARTSFLTDVKAPNCP
ncbi:MAG: hypothetical protein RBT63_04565 [Bdellovibrionales bacterium]|jgi:hypothetical protein|nr:hypothetical protein [Bdellovibrionales bacterium]